MNYLLITWGAKSRVFLFELFFTLPQAMKNSLFSISLTIIVALVGVNCDVEPISVISYLSQTPDEAASGRSLFLPDDAVPVFWSIESNRRRTVEIKLRIRQSLVLDMAPSEASVTGIYSGIVNLGIMQAYLLPNEGSAHFLTADGLRPAFVSSSSSSDGGLQGGDYHRSFRSSLSSSRGSWASQSIGSDSSRSLFASPSPPAQLIALSSERGRSAVPIPHFRLVVLRGHRCTDNTAITDVTIRFSGAIMNSDEHDTFILAFLVGSYLLTVPKVYLLATRQMDGIELVTEHVLWDQARLLQDIEGGYCRDPLGERRSVDTRGFRIAAIQHPGTDMRPNTDYAPPLLWSDYSPRLSHDGGDEDTQYHLATEESLRLAEERRLAATNVRKPVDLERFRHSFRRLTPEQMENTCAVCQEAFQDVRNSVVLIDCGHLFHLSCLQGWVDGAGNCPICREKIENNK